MGFGSSGGGGDGGGLSAANFNFIMWSASVLSGQNAKQFAFPQVGLERTVPWEAVEGNIDIAIDYAFTLIRVRAAIQNNTKDGASLYGLRDDAADAGSVSVAASTNGEFDSGALSAAVASGSKITQFRDYSASTAGSIEAHVIMECEQT